MQGMNGDGNEGLIVSVVVCTFNRSTLLDVCLESLAGQRTDGRLWEVVVVDNGSTDDTGGVAGRYAERHGNFRVAVEREIGLSRARNRGYRESAGGYVAYIDDDARARPDWVSVMIDFIRRNPGVAAFGGPDYGYALCHRPEWLPPEYMWTELDTAKGRERPIRFPGERYTGCNMVFRKDVLESFGGFDADLGMSGTGIGYGEETNLLLSMQRAGHTVWYLHDLKVDHLIQEHKMSLRWNLRSFYENGRTYDRTVGRKYGLFMRILRLFGAAAAGMIQFVNPRAMPFKRRLYYSLRYPVSEIGACVTYVESLRNKGRFHTG
jgi:glycosyltransferase involved in cell wall biosynthesis